MAKKIGLVLEVQSKQVFESLSKIDVELGIVNKSLRATKKQLEIFAQGGDDAKELTEVLSSQGKTIQDVEKEYVSLKAQQAQLRQEQKDLNKQVRETTRAFKEAKFPKGSLEALKVEYRDLTKQLSLLTKEELKNANNKALIEKSERLSNEINERSKSFGNFKDNIGRYEESVVSALNTTQSLFSESFSTIAAGLGIGGAIGAGLELIGSGIEVVQQLGQEFIQLRGQIQSLTGIKEPEVLKQLAAQRQSFSRNF